jgi:MFS family permease
MAEVKKRIGGCSDHCGRTSKPEDKTGMFVVEELKFLERFRGTMICAKYTPSGPQRDEMKKDSLLTKEFVTLNIASFLAQINMAIFYQLHQYLIRIGIDQEWAGFLIGVFSLAGVLMQPILSPFVNIRNARRTLAVGVCVTIAALMLYRWATSFPTLLGVRIIHGIGFITFTTAMNAILVSYIPVRRSGQAFGLISVNMLLPMAVVPALLGWLSIGPDRFVDMLTITACLMVPTALLPSLISGKNVSVKLGDGQKKVRIWQEIKQDFSDPRIPVLLFTNFLNFLAYTPVFFLFKEFAEGRGIKNPGAFFSVATAAMMAIRLVAGHLFDRLYKARMLIGTLFLVSFGYSMLVFARPATYLLFAVILGVGWSLFMPFLNALLFDCSKASARALNLNLSMVLLQLGYFVGPIIGTTILQRAGFSGVFLYCGFVTAAAACLNLFFIKSYERRR